MAQLLKPLPENFLDDVWNRFAEITDDSDWEEAISAIDDVCDMFNALDPERFPLMVDGEVVEEEEDDDFDL